MGKGFDGGGDREGRRGGAHATLPPSRKFLSLEVDTFFDPPPHKIIIMIVNR